MAPFLLCIFCTHCTDRLVLSELANNRVKYLLKGTYESNDPHPWRSQLYLNDYIEPTSSSLIPTDLKKDISRISSNDLKIYIDIAETALSTSSIDSKNIDLKNLAFFSTERQLLCPTYQSARGKKLKSCEASSGIEKLNNFFEKGIEMPTFDIKVADYSSIALFPRRFVTYPAKDYEKLTQITDIESVFDNDKVKGFNIIDDYKYSLTDKTDEVGSRIFPLLNNEIDIKLKAGEYPFVIEVRVFMKNLMMVHAIHKPDSAKGRLFIGPSDWLTDHSYDDTSYPNGQSPEAQRRLGGNLLITARTYEPHTASTLEIINTGNCSGGLAYYTILAKGTSFNKSKLPLAATSFNADAVIRDLPPGEYDLYVTQDRLWNKNSNECEGQDGFPESFRSCNSVSLGESETKQIEINCPCPDEPIKTCS